MKKFYEPSDVKTGNKTSDNENGEWVSIYQDGRIYIPRRIVDKTDLKIDDRLKELNKGWRPDWESKRQYKYEAFYDYQDCSIRISPCLTTRSLPDWFQGKSEEIWKQVIDEFGEEKIKLALWPQYIDEDET